MWDMNSLIHTQPRAASPGHGPIRAGGSSATAATAGPTGSSSHVSTRTTTTATAAAARRQYGGSSGSSNGSSAASGAVQHLGGSRVDGATADGSSSRPAAEGSSRCMSSSASSTMRPPCVPMHMLSTDPPQPMGRVHIDAHKVCAIKTMHCMYACGI